MEQPRFSAGLVALAVFIWLALLWRPQRQVELHSRHLLTAIEDHNWFKVADAVADDYRDRWGNDRSELLERLHEGMRSAPGLRIRVGEAETQQSDSDRTWRAKITLVGGGEFAQPVIERINTITAPFELRWHHASGKPWDWKLVEVRNPEFELPER